MSTNSALSHRFHPYMLPGRTPNLRLGSSQEPHPLFHSASQNHNSVSFLFERLGSRADTENLADYENRNASVSVNYSNSLEQSQAYVEADSDDETEYLDDRNSSGIFQTESEDSSDEEFCTPRRRLSSDSDTRPCPNAPLRNVGILTKVMKSKRSLDFPKSIVDAQQSDRLTRKFLELKIQDNSQELGQP